MPEIQYRATVRPGQPQRGPRVVAIAAVVFIAVALIKPWPDRAGDPRSVDRSPGTNGRVLASLAVPAPDASRGPNSMPCLAGAETQIVTVERSLGREVRSWIAVVDEVASDASQLREPPVTVFSTDVVGVGVCGPDSIGAAAGTSDPSGAAIRTPQAASMITVVVSGASGTTGRLVVGIGAPLGGQDAGADFARLYGPPQVPIAPVGAGSPRPGRSTSSSEGSASRPPFGEPAERAWPVGSYAIAFRYRSDGPAVVRWVRMEIQPGTPTGE